MEWVVSLDAGIPQTFSEELADQLIEQLDDYSPAIGGRGHRIGVTMSVDASTVRQALDRGYAVLRKALGHGAVIASVKVQSLDELERELEAPQLPALAGLSETAEILGVSRQRASELAERRDFPRPVAGLASGPVWLRSTIVSFNERWVRRPGRPRTVHEKHEEHRDESRRTVKPAARIG
ncbi:MAG TPA: hypothetical protein VIR57_20935 [Chloroflexota bacterium]|jgi:hypothetical protein